MRIFVEKLLFILTVLLVCGAVVNCKATITSGQSCSLPPKHIKSPDHVKTVVHIDNAFSPEQRLAITNAFLMWTNATGGQIEVSFASKLNEDDVKWDVATQGCNPHLVVVSAPSDSPGVQFIENLINTAREKDEDEGQLLGYTKKSCEFSYILLVTDRLEDSDDLRLVMAHEIGHYVGVKHIRVPKKSREKALMYPYADSKHSAKCITRLDLIGFCDENGCIPGDLHPCEQ